MKPRATDKKSLVLIGETTRIGLSRCSDGRWDIENVGIVWEKDLIKELKKLVPKEEGWL